MSRDDITSDLDRVLEDPDPDPFSDAELKFDLYLTGLEK